jgi:hypothetical protein
VSLQGVEVALSFAGSEPLAHWLESLEEKDGFERS